MSNGDVAGRLGVVIWNRTLWWAVDELVDKLTPKQLRKLKVRSGEHLAAILTTFLRTAHRSLEEARNQLLSRPQRRGHIDERQYF